ncbi:gamma-aminobutyric acid receptor subunit beta-like isoform X1 [Stegodyphus dumicola]|uniref:gamma-aminobutyric acid receptor subunit beta-like isoform X1 n=2 Tax=Stegodyphus dumicola TaxID=202533 RepID=UPI0015A7842D|nr:gamma-aminobutyric acid receptor subunit beta-like isoform X1 [Stegodyphus dumicola]
MKEGMIASLMLCVLLFLAPALRNQGTVAASGDDRVNITKILNAFFDQGYDRRVRPNYGGPPVIVSVTMFILSISSVSEVLMDFTLDFYFRQAWTDDRLSFTPRTGFESLTVGAEVADRIWVPDTFFVNEKSAYFHKATTQNTFLRISAGGEVFRSIRLTVTAGCPMDLQYFPMDRQVCFLEIESFGYTMRDIRYKWGDGEKSIGMSTDVELPQFKVLGHRQDQKEEHLTTGNYSRLVCEIQFVRSMGYYLIQIYIPAGLIVIISWVSFWLHRNATPARVALGVTTVLTMTTLMSSTNSALPKISYVKSIDVYLGTCFVMVFASLLEYATVGYLGKRISMRKARNQQMAKMAQEHRQRCVAAAAAAEGPERCPPPEAVLLPGNAEVTMVKSAVRGQPIDHRTKLPEARIPLRPATVEGLNKEQADVEAGAPKLPEGLFGILPSDIDKYSRLVFPVIFISFNLTYWIIYLHISDTLGEDNVALS